MEGPFTAVVEIGGPFEFKAEPINIKGKGSSRVIEADR